MRRTPHLVYLVLTKRPELISRRLPDDWGDGWPNVWLGVSVGSKMCLNKMDTLRKVRVHPKAVRFLSAEPLLENIADQIDLSGFGWVIVGGESGPGPEYLWNAKSDWRKEFLEPGRRIMKLEWARNLLAACRRSHVPFFFKQITAFRSGEGEQALGSYYREVPSPPMARWAAKISSARIPQILEVRGTH